jgi:WD40 repeat protein
VERAHGGPIAVLTGHTDLINTVAFSPDGATLATGSVDGTARLWNARTGPPVATLTGHTRSVWAVAFSPDGAILATGSVDGTARLWNARTGGPIAVLTAHTDRISTVAFSPDGTTLATGSWDHTARLWNVGWHTDPLRVMCADVGPPTADEWTAYAPGEPTVDVCSGS